MRVVLLACLFVLLVDQSSAAPASVLTVNATINGGDVPDPPAGGWYTVVPQVNFTFSGVQDHSSGNPYFTHNTAFFGTPQQLSFLLAQPFYLPCGTSQFWIYSGLFVNFTITYIGANYTVTLSQYTLNRTEPLTMIHNVEVFQCQANQFCLVTGFEGAASWQYTFFLNTNQPPAPPSVQGAYQMRFTHLPSSEYDQLFAYAGNAGLLASIGFQNQITLYTTENSGQWQNVSLVASNLQHQYSFQCNVANSYFPAFVFNQQLSFSTKDYLSQISETYSTHPPSSKQGQQTSSTIYCNYKQPCQQYLPSDGWSSYSFTFEVDS